MIEVTQNYELKGRGVEIRETDFLVKRDTILEGAGNVIQPCLKVTGKLSRFCPHLPTNSLKLILTL